MKWILLTLIFALLPNASYAQLSKAELFRERQVQYAEEQYLSQAAMVKDMNPDFSWARLRQWFPQTSYYDPTGEAVQLELIALSKAFQDAETEEKKNALKEEFAVLTHLHLPNPDVMATAYSLTEKDEALGDPKFYQWALWSNVDYIAGSNTGRSFENSIRVLTMGEEVMIFKALGLNYIAFEETYQADTYYYNIHRVQDPATAQTFRFFTNVTTPFFHLNQQDRR